MDLVGTNLLISDINWLRVNKLLSCVRQIVCLMPYISRLEKAIQIYQETNHIEFEGNFLPQVYVEDAKN